MGRIVISTNVTLDGVSQDPTGEEGSDVGGWFLEISEGDRAAWAALEHEEAKNTAAYLVGGRSYEWFATRWVGREGEWAAVLNGTPKYVVRSHAGWIGTRCVFDVAPTESGTVLRFTHDGLFPHLACYDVCSQGWDHYVGSSLVALTGGARAR